MVARLVGPAAAEVCPGGLRPVAARDGDLARIRLPGGFVTAAQLQDLATLADRFGDGELDLTARANVQIRGLRAEARDAFAAALAAAGLLPSATHELVRNVRASAFAGLDPAEIADPRPLVRDFDVALTAEPSLAALPPKFSVAFDGGGRFFDLGGADLAAVAIAPQWFELVIGGVTSGAVVRSEAVVRTMVALARRALDLAAACGARDGRWRVARLPALRAALAAEAATLGFERGAPSPPLAGLARRSPRPPAAVAPGIVFGRDRLRVALVPAVPLGRLSAAQARAIAEAARTAGADLRLAEWRGIVLGDVAIERVPAARLALETVGLFLDDRAGFAGLAACAGHGACGSALADVRADAAAFAARLAADRIDAAAAEAFSVNFAGCEKRCAMRGPADAELVATERGYELRVGRAGEPPRASPAAAQALSVEDALARLERTRAERTA